MSTSLLHSIPRAAAAAPFSASPKIRVSPRHKHYSATAAATSVSSGTSLTLRAALDGGGGAPRRLVDLIRALPDLSRNYFRSPSRRALFGGISLLGGFYVAQTISLSFGALGVNDVIAAVLCVLVTEYATKFYYSRDKLFFRCCGV
uniref:Uncharacterized protein n=1 Tax=Kalanchoe fedtschenkoi TaxID=63787 RepID=A0A7N0V4J1_KALFE